MICEVCGEYTHDNHGIDDMVVCIECSLVADGYYDSYGCSQDFLDNQTDASGITICDSDPGL